MDLDQQNQSFTNGDRAMEIHGKSERELNDLYFSHLETRVSLVNKFLERHQMETLVIDAGGHQTYFRDDIYIPFRTHPHFAHYCPDRRPGHFLEFSVGKKPKLIYVKPQDFWHDSFKISDQFWTSGFDIEIVESRDKAWDALGSQEGVGIFTECRDRALALGLSILTSQQLMDLDWGRVEKTFLRSGMCPWSQ